MIRLSTMKYEISKRIDFFWLWIARYMPRDMRYWATIQSCVLATTGQYASTDVISLTIDDMLRRQ